MSSFHSKWFTESTIKSMPHNMYIIYKVYIIMKFFSGWTWIVARTSSILIPFNRSKRSSGIYCKYWIHSSYSLDQQKYILNWIFLVYGPSLFPRFIHFYQRSHSIFITISSCETLIILRFCFSSQTLKTSIQSHLNCEF